MGTIGKNIGNAFSSLGAEYGIGDGNAGGGALTGSISGGLNSGISAGLMGLGNKLTGGLRSGAGNVTAGITSGLSKLPGMAGLVGGAAGSVLTTGVNALFGSKLNEENIAQVKDDTARANANTVMSDSNYDDLLERAAGMTEASNFGKSYIGKDGVFSSKAQKVYNRLKSRATLADERQRESIALSAEQIAGEARDEALRNYKSNGGKIEIKPSHRGLFSAKAKRAGMGTQAFAAHVLANKGSYPASTVRQANFARNAAKWHDDGGDLRGLVDDINARSDANFVRRLLDPERATIPDWEHKGYVATHKMSWADGPDGKAVVYPAVQEIDGKLKDLTDPRYGLTGRDILRSAIARGDTLMMTRPEADIFTRTYKKYYPFGKDMNRKGDGGPLWALALGGDLGTAGANFSSGLTEINEGGSHETNPLEGVPMGADTRGVPNVVEEGETIYDGYVFSNRLKLPDWIRKKYKLGGKKGKGMTFADASKRLAKESAERPNDPISGAGLAAAMDDLREAQEVTRQAREAGKRQAVTDILHSNGLPTPEEAAEAQGLATMMAEAQGAATQGGQGQATPEGQALGLEAIAQQYAFGGPVNRLDDGDYLSKSPSFYDYLNNYRYNDYYRLDSGNPAPRDWNDYLNDKGYMNLTKKDTKPLEAPAIPRLGTKKLPAISVGNLNNPNPNPATKPENNTVKPLPEWTRYAPLGLYGSMALTDALGLTNKPDYTEARMIQGASDMGYRPVRAGRVGSYMTYRPFDRNWAMNAQRASDAATRRSLAQNAGLNRGTAAASLLAADAARQKSLGELAREAQEHNNNWLKDVKTFNRETDTTNITNALAAAQANQDAYASAADRHLRGVTNAAAYRNQERNAVADAKASNLSNLATSMENYGLENKSYNYLKFLIDSGAMGSIRDEYLPYLLTRRAFRRCGGKLK